MKVEKIDRVVIQVRDAKKANEFFTDLFETKFSPFDEFPETGSRSFVNPFGIETVEPSTPDSLLTKAIEKRGEGLAVVSLKVPNLDEAVAEMKSRGIRQTVTFDRENWRAVMFHPADTYGVTIELIEYKTKHPLLAATKE